MQKLLKPTQVAEILGKAVQTLAAWRCTRAFDLPYRKIGGAVRYVESDVLAFIEKSRSGADGR